MSLRYNRRAHSSSTYDQWLSKFHAASCVSNRRSARRRVDRQQSNCARSRKKREFEKRYSPLLAARIGCTETRISMTMKCNPTELSYVAASVIHHVDLNGKYRHGYQLILFKKIHIRLEMGTLTSSDHMRFAHPRFVVRQSVRRHQGVVVVPPLLQA